MIDLSFYKDDNFDPDGVRPSDAVARAFLISCADIHTVHGVQRIDFTAPEFVTWYENEVEVIKQAMFKDIYKEMYS